ncbi:putative E3 ubiquitin-protein ligase [Nymphaea thermarum]|nr:putative E3 ubiquitin-protein ligase [Nymphaea thermarum]
MAEAFQDEVEQTVTIDEYIQGMEEQELEADLVLGGDEGNECTYNKGYMKRQAIFSCLTCTPDGNAGVCTACCLACHDGHEVVELWTKRNFRCDCGNSKFGNFTCKLFSDKDPENKDNSYNHNYRGAYCTCGRPYPDPDAVEQVEMIQCCICEDWFHENHIGLGPSEEIPRDDEGEPIYADFICQDCAISCSFLKLYPSSIWVLSGRRHMVVENGSSSSVMPEKDICSGNPTSNSVVTDAGCVAVLSENGMEAKGNVENNGDLIQENTGDPHVQTPACVLGHNLLEASLVLEKKPMFLSKGWRDQLCHCGNCREFYDKKNVAHLIDKEDSMEEYEKVAKQKRAENLQQQEGAELNFLNKLNHVQQIEILSGIADMKNEFRSFLESVDPSKPVTPADIKQVFDNLARKRQRLL